MSSDAAQTPVQAVLDALARDLGELDGVKQARVWEGAWDALESPGQLSLPSPAVLVSLVDFEIVHVGQTIDGRGGLPASPARIPPSAGGALSFRPDGVVRATADVEIAATCIAADPGAGKRAATALDLATRAVPVLVRRALLDIAGANLDSSKLRVRGLSAVVLVGRREICLAPAGEDRRDPARVDVIGTGGARETAWERT